MALRPREEVCSYRTSWSVCESDAGQLGSWAVGRREKEIRFLAKVGLEHRRLVPGVETKRESCEIQLAVTSGESSVTVPGARLARQELPSASCPWEVRLNRPLCLPAWSRVVDPRVGGSGLRCRGSPSGTRGQAGHGSRGQLGFVPGGRRHGQAIVCLSNVHPTAVRLMSGFQQKLSASV
ncbi:unnamed protein product [Protopolystoma xenopodis]|uniref:Uncharacterized protein n=1 Tax=Protopolystoma xenopodis TaxID=117903 RepID=A0A3S5AIA7_9PLAT|nr:unnamed protein product [Protopolystoma xenopodis]